MKILGYNYKVVHKAMKKNLGKYKFSKLEISIDTKQAQQQLESTTLHEILHAISEHLKLKLDEDTVGRLEVGLYQSLTDNGVDLSPLTRIDK
jgi:hypothetical protein